jgi:hypothetical protein
MFERILHMKTVYTMDWNIPASHPHTFYIVNINTFTHERELPLKPDFLPEISNIRIFRPSACEQSGYKIEGTENNSRSKKRFPRGCT